jgi:hypothetical protein
MDILGTSAVESPARQASFGREVALPNFASLFSILTKSAITALHIWPISESVKESGKNLTLQRWIAIFTPVFR